MTQFIWIIPAFPLLSFLIIALTGKFISKKVVAWLGTGSIVLSALVTVISGIDFLSASNSGQPVRVILYEWINTGGFSANFALWLDQLSLVFCFVITFVGALIHLYSVEYMYDDEGFARFFAYMNLFVCSMLILVLADNLLLLYLGWEGVGLCSYLLIGFWYKEPENGAAARKAFIVTRVGDTAMIIGLFLLFVSLGTLNISELMQKAGSQWTKGSPLAVISAFLLLGGAIGKSAQLPLQTWLPDAMAGPSPVSALIHAATMVTAGVYLITRTHVLFMLAPPALLAVAIIGAVTLLISGLAALGQTDLKRVLAYSTISQIGYMFFAMGIGAWSAAVFHFMIHAFFKALLFLSAGAVIHLLHEQDMFKMGGLRKKMPLIFVTFLIGSASLSALPLITAGFYSKDQILWFGWSSQMSSSLLWAAGITGALLTSVYTFRAVFITFYGDVHTEPHHRSGILINIPLVVLAVLSVFGGFIEMPENLGPVHLFSRLFSGTLPVAEINEGGPEWLFQMISAVISLTGIYVAWRLFYKRRDVAVKMRDSNTGRFFLGGLGFDKLYDFTIARPFKWLSEINKNDFVDSIYTSIARLTEFLSGLFSRTQSGRLRWYVLFLTIGIVALLTIMISI